MPFVAQRGRGVLVWLVAAMMVHAALAATPVSVQLVLAVDVSGSVSQDRFELQREGYAAAFRNPAVLQAIRSTSTGSIAVAMLQWTGPALHVVAADWTAIDDAASAERFAEAIERAPRALFGGGTSISGAIDYARQVIAASSLPGAAARDRRIRRWGEQSRAGGRGRARRGGSGRHGDQRSADPDAGAGT